MKNYWIIGALAVGAYFIFKAPPTVSGGGGGGGTTAGAILGDVRTQQAAAIAKQIDKKTEGVITTETGFYYRPKTAEKGTAISTGYSDLLVKSALATYDTSGYEKYVTTDVKTGVKSAPLSEVSYKKTQAVAKAKDWEVSSRNPSIIKQGIRGKEVHKSRAQQRREGLI